MPAILAESESAHIIKHRHILELMMEPDRPIHDDIALLITFSVNIVILLYILINLRNDRIIKNTGHNDKELFYMLLETPIETEIYKNCTIDNGCISISCDEEITNRGLFLYIFEIYYMALYLFLFIIFRLDNTLPKFCLTSVSIIVKISLTISIYIIHQEKKYSTEFVYAYILPILTYISCKILIELVILVNIILDMI